MSKINYEINGRFIQLPDSYETIARFELPIHNIPLNDKEYKKLKSLIAAAPELLEVAEMLLHEYNYYHIAEEEHTRQIFEKLKKVIAKAKKGDKDE